MGTLKYAEMLLVDTASTLPAIADKGQIGYAQDTGLAYQFDGGYWSPSAKVSVKKTSAAINAKNTGNTLLYTLENSSFNFYPTMVVPRATGVGISGVVTGPTMSIGTNATSYNNVAVSSLLSNVLTTLTGGNSLSTTIYSPGLAGNTAIYVNVSVAAVATNYTVLYDIIGFYDL